MRTTPTMDDAVCAAALDEALRSRRSLGVVVSEWAGRGLEATNTPAPAARSGGIPTFRVRRGSPPITGSQGAPLAGGGRIVKVCLLDVNVLLAAAWPKHIHHAVASSWVRQHAASGLAECHGGKLITLDQPLVKLFPKQAILIS